MKRVVGRGIGWGSVSEINDVRKVRQLLAGDLLNILERTAHQLVYQPLWMKIATIFI